MVLRLQHRAMTLNMDHLMLQTLAAFALVRGGQGAPIGRPPKTDAAPNFPVQPKVKPQARQKKGFGFAYEAPVTKPSLYSQGVMGKPDPLGGYKSPVAQPSLYSQGYTGNRKYKVPKAKPTLYSQGFGLSPQTARTYKSPVPSQKYDGPAPPEQKAEATPTADLPVRAVGIAIEDAPEVDKAAARAWIDAFVSGSSEAARADLPPMGTNFAVLFGGMLVGVGAVFSAYLIFGAREKGNKPYSGLALGDSFLSEKTSIRSIRGGGKALACLAVVVGLSWLTPWSNSLGVHEATLGGTTMFARPPAFQKARSWQPMPSVRTRAGYSVQPVRAIGIAIEDAPEVDKAAARAWIDAFVSGSAGGAAAPSAGAAAPPAGASGEQGEMKKVWDLREEKGLQLAQFYVKAKNPIKSQGADVPEGAWGIRCSGLIQWENGCYSSESGPERVTFGGDFELAKARMSESEAKAWRDDYRAKFAARGPQATQEDLKKVYEQRQNMGLDIASIPIKALRQVNEQGANVPADTMGMLEGTLIRWDNGAYSDGLRRSQDFEVSRPLEKAR